MYGLKQSSVLWYKNYLQLLIELKLKPVAEVDCLFINSYMLLFFFVDDIVMLFDWQHLKKINEFQVKFFNIYEMRYLGNLEWFLGIWISRDRAT